MTPVRPVVHGEGWNKDTGPNAILDTQPGPVPHDRSTRNTALCYAGSGQLKHLRSFLGRLAWWWLEVPNGAYLVRLVAGDPAYYNSLHVLDVEGVRAVEGTPTSANPWIEGTVQVTVADGRLTISNAPGSANNKLAFVEIRTAGP